jgi:hypothetical protein
MPGELQPTLETPPLPNSPEARTSDGTLKGQISTTPTPPTLETPLSESDLKPVSKAPESYTFTAPEGKTLDAKLVERATPVFKELGLDQASAQKLVDTWNDLAGDSANLAVEAVKQMREVWAGEVKSKYGAELDSKIAEIGRMKDSIFAGDKDSRVAFERAMDLTGAGDNPAIFNTFLKLATQFTEGKHVLGAGPSPEGQRAPGKPAAPSAAQAMWPSLPSNTA